MSKTKGGAALRVIEVALMLIAVASLTAFGLLELEQNRGQADLRAQFERESPAADGEVPAELPGEPDVREEPAEEPGLAAGGALGRLTSRRIGLDVMIAEGVDHATLRRAAGRIPGTARFDGEGNVGVAAHRDTFFRPLREIQKGDVLEVETHRGRYRYRVSWTAVVEPSNVEFLEPSAKAELTLVTCFPFYYVGPAPRRFIVRAERLDGMPGLTAASR